MEWVAAVYGQKQHSYTRRPHLYRDECSRSVCGRAQRGGMNRRALDDPSLRRLCAICEAIEATHAAYEPVQEPTALSALPEDALELLSALSDIDSVPFRVVRVIGRNNEGVRRIEVEDGCARGKDVAHLVSMVYHDATGVRFVTADPESYIGWSGTRYSIEETSRASIDDGPISFEPRDEYAPTADTR